VSSFNSGATNSEELQHLVDRLICMLDIHGDGSESKFEDWLSFVAMDTTYGKRQAFPSTYSKTLKLLQQQAGLSVSE